MSAPWRARPFPTLASVCERSVPDRLLATVPVAAPRLDVSRAGRERHVADGRTREQQHLAGELELDLQFDLARARAG